MNHDIPTESDQPLSTQTAAELMGRLVVTVRRLRDENERQRTVGAACNAAMVRRMGESLELAESTIATLRQVGDRLADRVLALRGFVEADHIDRSPPIPPPEPTDRDWEVSALIEKSTAALTAWREATKT